MYCDITAGLLWKNVATAFLLDWFLPFDDNGDAADADDDDGDGDDDDGDDEEEKEDCLFDSVRALHARHPWERHAHDAY